jgi:hypothetical protein
MQANGIVLQNPEQIQKAEVFDIFGKNNWKVNNLRVNCFSFRKIRMYILKITTRAEKFIPIRFNTF